MKTHLAMPIIVTGLLVSGGCATKKYVQTTTAPIQTKVDQTSELANKNAAALEEARKELARVEEQASTGISQAKERAMTADNRAGEAMKKANEAGSQAAEARSLADKNKGELAALRNVIANIDDYRLASEATILFGFGKDTLTPETKQQLDQLVSGKDRMKRFVISVQGFTDQTGSVEYNTQLSQRRATHVVNYLVAQHNIPVYRIHMVGLGKEKLVDDGKTREARSKNRRVEVKIFSADQATGSLASTGQTR